MSSRTILIDCCLAVAFAILLLLLAPGLGIVALIAILIVIVCAASVGIEWIVRLSRRHARPGR